MKFISFLPLASLSLFSYGQKAAPDLYRDEPFVVEHSDVIVRMKADGKGERVTHILMRVQSEGVARQLSVLNFSYAAAEGTGVIDYTRVHKADGTTVETPVADAIELAAEVTREAPVYSDIREKHLPVRSLAVGDELEYQFRTIIDKPITPNQFWGAEHLVAGGNVVLSQTLTLEAPASVYLQVWSPNHPVTSTVQDGLKIWKWNASQIKPSSRNEDGTMKPAEVKDPDEDPDGRQMPSIAWTTFHDWAEVGAWYRALIEPRMEPTTAIRAKAEELTREAKTPDEQVKALYQFVAEQIRYVSISFGLGRIQPHAAAEVLANGYGDCKDKDTLLESLLRAKGFTTAPVLIGAGIAPVPDVPSPAVFNHEITTVELPGMGRIWLDSTAEVAPYRVLLPMLRDQLALVLTTKSPASLQKTPADPPFPYKERFDSIMKLDAKGVLKGSVSMTLRSDSELLYRTLIRQAAPAQWDSVMQYMSNAMNLGGKVSETDLRQTESGGPVRIAYKYKREDFADWKNDRILANFPTLDVTMIDKDKAPDHDIDLGAPRTLEAHSEITLPGGDRAELPGAVHVDSPYMRFDQTYQLKDGQMIADRVLVVKQHKLSKGQWKEYLAFAKSAGWDDGEKYAILLPPPPATQAAASADVGPPDFESAPYQTLEDYVVQCELRGDWVSARRYAERSLVRFPQQPYAHSILAFIDEHDRKYDQAIRGYEAELASHPDDRSDVIRLLAGTYILRKQYPEAIALLRRNSSRNEVTLQQQLILAQMLNGDLEGALATTRDSMRGNPDNKSLQTQEARLLQQLKRADEAEQSAKRALDGNDDPNLINSNAYFLAEMKRDLPFAEANSRRSIELFDRKNVETTIDEANSGAFNLSSQMIAAWDTLGDILLMEKKLKEAEPYLAAAWFNRPEVVVGNHLAELYEQLGRKGEAHRIDKLALSMPQASDDSQDRADLVAREARLLKENVKLPAGEPETLQQQRTFHLKNTAAVAGSGTVRVQLGASGILSSTLVSGDSSLKPLLVELHNISFPGVVPPALPAHVLRDAILYCSKGARVCDFVFLERSGIAQEASLR